MVVQKTLRVKPNYSLKYKMFIVFSPNNLLVTKKCISINKFYLFFKLFLVIKTVKDLITCLSKPHFRSLVRNLLFYMSKRTIIAFLWLVMF